MQKKVIGLSGCAGAGKDTFYSLALQYFKSIKPEARIERVAFADALKDELKDVVADMGYDVYTNDREQKSKFRHLLIQHGEGMRKQTNGTYWIEKGIERINQLNADIVFVTDVRYKNEINALRNEYGIQYKNIYIQMNDGITGEHILPTIPTEIENDVDLIEFSHYFFEWNNGDIHDSSHCNYLYEEVTFCPIIRYALDSNEQRLSDSNLYSPTTGIKLPL